MRMRARRDATEPSIISAWEQIGCVVYRLNDPSLPDALVWRRGLWIVAEIKSPGGTLTPAQVRTYMKTPFPIVESPDEALALFGITS